MTKLWILLLKGGLVQDEAPGIAPKAGIARHDNRREVVPDVTVFVAKTVPSLPSVHCHPSLRCGMHISTSMNKFWTHLLLVGLV